MKSLTFKNIENERIKSIFRETAMEYDFPEEAKILLASTPLKGSTMQAQPVIRLQNLLGGIDTYRIRLATFVRDSKKLKVSELEDDVLTGWFAHELGHVVDYMAYSLTGMIGYGIKYALSQSFRREVEHRADEIAIEQGFQDYILKTKTFLFHHEMIDEKYRNKMKRYYMSIEDAEAIIGKMTPIDPID